MKNQTTIFELQDKCRNIWALILHKAKSNLKKGVRFSWAFNAIGIFLSYKCNFME